MAIIDGLDALSSAQLFSPRLLKLAVGTSSYISGSILGLSGVHSVFKHEHVKAEERTRCYCWCEETAAIDRRRAGCFGEAEAHLAAGGEITCLCHAFINAGLITARTLYVNTIV